MAEKQPEGFAGTAIVVRQLEVALELASASDDAQERDRLEKELAEIESQISRLEALLSGPFSQKAPEKVVNAEREKLETYRVTAQKLRERVNS